jgi:hypothetical protein
VDYDNVIAQALAELIQPAPTLPDIELKSPPPERFTRRGLTLQTAPTDRQRPSAITVDQVPKMLIDAATTYLKDPNPGTALLLAAPAGSGKTTVSVALAERLASQGRRILYAGPRRDFYADVQELANRPAWWYQWQPRQYGDFAEGEPQTCRWAPQMDRWLGRGYPAMDFCSNPRICGWDYVRNRCPYHKQKERGENIIFGQHAHVALGHPLMEHFSLIIGDELPLSAFLWPWRIPITDILPAGVDDEQLATLLRNLKWLCVQTPEAGQQWSGEDLYHALPGGARAVLAVTERYKISLSAAAYTPELRTAAGVDEAPYFHLPSLMHLMHREAQRVADGLPIIGRVRCSVDGLVLSLKHTPPHLPKHVIWCDATGNAHLYQALLGLPIEVVQPEVQLTGRIFQLWHSTNNRSAVLDDRPDPGGQARGLAKQTQLRQQIARIVETRGYTAPALISYKALSDSLLPGADHTHFGGSRGTNRLQSCDALFVVGAPLPTHAAIKEIAAMVYFDRDEPWRDDWHAKDIPFPAQPAAYSVGGFWDDPDLQALVEQLRESELVQAVHRARPLRRPVDVWLLTNVVTDLPVTLMSLHELFGALDRDGKPLTGIDVLRWPDVLALPASEADPLTTTRLMDAFDITRPTAGKWLSALEATGQYTLTALDQTGQRGPKTRAVVKRFDPPK